MPKLMLDEAENPTRAAAQVSKKGIIQHILHMCTQPSFGSCLKSTTLPWILKTTMRPSHEGLLDVVPANIRIIREIDRSDASLVFEIELEGRKYAMKLLLTLCLLLTTQFHDIGNPGFAENGRDLNRFRCELNAYMNLRKHGVCEGGFVPYFYGYIDRIDPAAFFPVFQHFTRDRYYPRAILLEYLPNAEILNCENYPEACYHQAIEGMKQIHAAYVHHQDIYPKNILVVSGVEKRMVWVDFDVATTFSIEGPDEQRLSEEEDTLLAEFGEFLLADQRQGLCKNTKWY
ncbi:hypothetical protein N7488_010013 [Penicillium malachiteum]|nr:hypothetical protein N7488_010013 [Penicillium malachiteum]